MSTHNQSTPEKSDSKMIHIRLPNSLHKSLRLLLVEKEKTMQEWVQGLITRELSSSSQSTRVLQTDISKYGKE